jgi:putative endonuclease
MRDYYVYIMTNNSGTLYTGVTNNLERRAAEHKGHLFRGFTDRYKVNRLLYYEVFQDVMAAIEREKQIKAWRRSKKLDLIVAMNPKWKDLTAEWE